MEATTDDMHRVRARLSNDASEAIRLLNSELETYRECFAPSERQKIREIIRLYTSLTKTL